MNFRASCTGHHFCISSPAQKRICISALLLFDSKNLPWNFHMWYLILYVFVLWLFPLGNLSPKYHACVAEDCTVTQGGACSRDGDPGKVKDECCDTSLLFSSEGATRSPTKRLWYLSEPDALILVEQYKHRTKCNPAAAGKNKWMQKWRTEQNESRRQFVKETTISGLLQLSHYLHKAASMTRDLKEQANSLSPGWAIQGGLWLINSNWKYSSHPAALPHSFLAHNFPGCIWSNQGVFWPWRHTGTQPEPWTRRTEISPGGIRSRKWRRKKSDRITVEGMTHLTVEKLESGSAGRGIRAQNSSSWRYKRSHHTSSSTGEALHKPQLWPEHWASHCTSIVQQGQWLCV